MGNCDVCGSGGGSVILCGNCRKKLAALLTVHPPHEDHAGDSRSYVCHGLPPITLDILPGEGEVRTVTKRLVRHECELCSEPAHFKHTFLLSGARSNPLSAAFGHDDCSRCSDFDVFACKEHRDELHRASPGREYCSTYAATVRYAHIFLYWREEG